MEKSRGVRQFVVLGGIVAVLTVTVLMGRLMPSPRHSMPVSVSAPIVPPEIAQESRDTLEQYQKAARLLDQKRVGEAIALLEQAQHRSLVIQSASAADSTSDITTGGILMQVAHTVARNAEIAASEGDSAKTRQWISVGRHLAEQVARTPFVTVEAVTLTRSVDSIIGRAERTITGRTTDPKTMQKVARRETRLDRFWKERVLSQISEAHAIREQEMTDIYNRHGGSGTTFANSLQSHWENEDRILARQLLALYCGERNKELAVA